jgi:hypothetical protein
MCCQRELREEPGIAPSIGRLLVIDWLPPAPMFVYDGGILSEDTMSQIVLPPEELVE